MTTLNEEKDIFNINNECHNQSTKSISDIKIDISHITKPFKSIYFPDTFSFIIDSNFSFNNVIMINIYTIDD
jgi:hypothetical protein